MTAYKKGKAVSQVTEILLDGVMYQEDFIREALKNYTPKNRATNGVKTPSKTKHKR